MKYQTHEIVREYYDLERMDVSTLRNGEVLRTVTNKGIIDGVAKITKETQEDKSTEKTYDNIKPPSPDYVQGFVKLDEEWTSFYDFKGKVNVADNNIDIDKLKYKYYEKSKLTVKVDAEIDINVEDLTIIYGIGEERNDFENIRDMIHFNCENNWKPYYSKHSVIPDRVKENIEERIKLEDAEREVLDREIIKKDIE